jgi:hypothetical protein
MGDLNYLMHQRPHFSFYGFYEFVNLCTINWGEFVVDECETVILILLHHVDIGVLRK